MCFLNIKTGRWGNPYKKSGSYFWPQWTAKTPQTNITQQQKTPPMLKPGWPMASSIDSNRCRQRQQIPEVTFGPSCSVSSDHLWPYSFGFDCACCCCCGWGRGRACGWGCPCSAVVPDAVAWPSTPRARLPDLLPQALWAGTSPAHTACRGAGRAWLAARLAPTWRPSPGSAPRSVMSSDEQGRCLIPDGYGYVPWMHAYGSYVFCTVYIQSTYSLHYSLH